MHNLWLEYLVEKFVESKGIRACGSCQGGCINATTCAFICCNYTKDDLEKFYEENKAVLDSEFERKIYGE